MCRYIYEINKNEYLINIVLKQYKNFLKKNLRYFTYIKFILDQYIFNTSGKSFIALTCYIFQNYIYSFTFRSTICWISIQQVKWILEFWNKIWNQIHDYGKIET